MEQVESCDYASGSLEECGGHPVELDVNGTTRVNLSNNHG